MAIHHAISGVLFFLMIALTQGHGAKHAGHTHHKPNTDSGNILNDKDLIRDYEHIKEDIQELYNQDFSDRLEAVDLEAYYFQLHDLDSSGKLDGLELLAAINHITGHDEEEIPEHYYEENRELSLATQRWWNDKFQEDAQMIDEILKEEDLDQDGFLSYMEFALGRDKEQDSVRTGKKKP